MSRTEYLLQIDNVTKLFPGTIALSNVSLAVKSGEIHALVGENGAGKSTLMNVIGGVFPATSGSVVFNGEICHFRNAQDAIKAGIGFVHQELSVFPHLSVAYNIFVDRIPIKKNGFLDQKKLRLDTQNLLQVFTNNISPDTKCSTLTVGNQQMVEIVRAISLNCKLIIFDEPTSSLTENGVADLFEIIRRLKSRGVSVLYITHRLSEIFEICDVVTVLKDGQIVDTKPIAETNTREVIGQMIGRVMGDFYPPKSSGISNEIFRIENFTGRKNYRNISFSLSKGEILGFYGLLGAGRSEVMRAICGIDSRISGNVFINGKEISIDTYHDCIRAGITYLTENRKQAGIFPSLSVMKNLYISEMCRLGGAFLDESQEAIIARKDIIEHGIKTNSINAQIQSLSGGNQQKVLIARNLRVKPHIIILDEPTRGIDVNAKAEIHKKIRKLAESGIGVIIISSEMPEVIGLCDRVIVMYEGCIKGILNITDLTEKNLIQFATNVSEVF